MSYESPISIYSGPPRIITEEDLNACKEFDAIHDAAERTAKGAVDMDGFVLKTVIDCGINADKDELLKALEYDRGQYEKGYADGKADSRKVGRWMPSTVIFPVKNTDGTYSNFGTLVCSSCNNPVALVKWNNYCPCCGARMGEPEKEAWE